jgi:hypothetical protein
MDVGRGRHAGAQAPDTGEAEAGVAVGERTLRRLAGLVVGTRRWFLVPGRRGLLLAAVGALLVVCGLMAVRSDRALLGDLRAHGQRTAAVITEAYSEARARGSGANIIVGVRFTVEGRQVSEPLRIQDTVPSGLRAGEPAEVVVDPSDPARVLLTSQLDDDDIVLDHAVADGGAALMAVGLGWWLARRRRRRSSLISAG